MKINQLIPVSLLTVLSLSGCFLKPVTVTGLTPPSGATADNTSSTVKLVWGEIPGADHYQVQVSTDAVFDDQDEIFDTPTFRFTLPDPPGNPVTIYWRVIPLFNHFWKRSDWSEPASVVVEHQPVAQARLKSPVHGRTYKNMAGLLLDWEDPIPAWSQASVEIFDPAGGEILWSGQVTGRTAVPFAEIQGLEYGEEPIRLGCRFTTVNRFGEKAPAGDDLFFRLADPWLPVDLANELYFGCSGEAFSSLWNSSRGLTIRETPWFPDKTLTSAPIRIPAGEQVEIVSESPEVLAQGPGGLRRYLLPLMEIRWQNRRGYVNGEHILQLSDYSEEEKEKESETGILWSVSLLPDTWTGELSVAYNAELACYRPGQPLSRYPLTVFDDPYHNSYIVPRDWYLSDVDGDGIEEAVIDGAIGAFKPHSSEGYSGWGSLIFHLDTDPPTQVMEEVYSYDEYANTGVYTWHDGDGDGIRETVYREWSYTFVDEYNPEDAEPTEMLLTEIWTRVPGSGVYQLTSEQREPLREDYTFIYMQSAENDLVRGGGK
jgi:hypothetical protein